MPLTGGDSQWPLRAPPAALPAMLELSVQEPVRTKALRCPVLPAAAFPLSWHWPGAREESFLCRLHNKYPLSSQCKPLAMMVI